MSGLFYDIKHLNKKLWMPPEMLGVGGGDSVVFILHVLGPWGLLFVSRTNYCHRTLLGPENEFQW